MSPVMLRDAHKHATGTRTLTSLGLLFAYQINKCNRKKYASNEQSIIVLENIKSPRAKFSFQVIVT